MSAGQFIRTFYATNSGAIARAVVQPETELASIGAVTNDGPAGPATIPTRVKMSKSRREIGIGPRKVGLAFSPGQEPDGYEPGTVIYIPAMTRAFYDAAVEGGAITYLGSQAVIVGKTEESIR